MTPEAGTLGAQLRNKLAAIRLNAEAAAEPAHDYTIRDAAVVEILAIVDEAVPLTEQADRDAAQHEGTAGALTQTQAQLATVREGLAALSPQIADLIEQVNQQRAGLDEHLRASLATALELYAERKNSTALRAQLAETEARLQRTEQALGAAKEAAAATALGDLWVAEAGAPASGGGSTSGGAEAQDGDASADLCICGHEAGEHYYEGECLFRVSDPNGSPIGATYCECNEFARAY